MKRRLKVGLLLQIVIAIVLGICCSWFFPESMVRIFVTFNSIFSNFLSFAIPLIIVGLVAPGIADLGSGAGKLLGITALVAYVSTLFAGFFSYFTCLATFPYLLPGGGAHVVSAAGTAVEATNPLASISSSTIEPFFTIAMPPFMDVVSALVLSFILGLGLAALPGRAFKDVLSEFGDIINMLIGKVIVPLLPLYIFGIFLKMGAEGQAAQVMKLFLKVIIIIFVMHIALLLIQYLIAGLIAKRNPLKLLKTMLPAYATALGTQSSAATIPVSLQQTIKMGVHPDLAGFVVPLCATIHLSGSILKIVACALAIMWMTPDTYPITFELYTGFIFMLGIAMVAAPGVPGGAIMAALGLLSSILGFNADLQALMIALYIAMDSFGTAGNVTGGGAIAIIMDKIYRSMLKKGQVGKTPKVA
jgi:Na+/H+-dicarboxylate symporter